MWEEFDIINVKDTELIIKRINKTTSPSKVINIYIYMKKKNGKIRVKGEKYLKRWFGSFMFIRSIYDIIVEYNNIRISREGNAIMIEKNGERKIIGLNEITKKGIVV